MNFPTFSDHILVETDEIIAWNKPSGLSSTGRSLDDPDCAQYLAIDYVGEMIWALHQLDRDSSGVLLFTRKKKLVSHWQRRWHSPSIRKFYVAVVHGRLPESSMTIDAPLSRKSSAPFIEVFVDPQGKEAQTAVREISTSPNENYSLVLAELLTGRTHQIRVHLQHIGCPLVGEARYNSIPCGHHHRHALHALAILTDEDAPLNHIEAPMADDLLALCDKLQIPTSPLNNWSQDQVV